MLIAHVSAGEGTQSYSTVVQVNYTNRNANSPSSTKELGVAYTSATVSALATAIGMHAQN